MAKVKMMNLQKGHGKVVKELKTILIEGSCTDSKQRKHFKQGRANNTIKCRWESQVMFTFGYLRIKTCRNLQRHAKYLMRNKFFIVPSGNTSKETYTLKVSSNTKAIGVLPINLLNCCHRGNLLSYTTSPAIHTNRINAFGPSPLSQFSSKSEAQQSSCSFCRLNHLGN